MGKMIVNYLIGYASVNSQTGTFTTIGGVSTKGKEPFYEKMGFGIIFNGIKKTVEIKLYRSTILREMRDNPNITARELKIILGISQTAVENHITYLREHGYIERIGSKKSGYWNVL